MPKPSTLPTVTLPLNLQVPENVFKFAEANTKEGSTVTNTIVGWILYSLEQTASGGLMLAAHDHDHLATLREGKKFRSSRELTSEVEKALRREDGQYSHTINIDPAYIPVMNERAFEQGVTPEEFVKNLFDYIMGSGFVYDFTPVNGIMFPVEYETMKQAREVLGRDPSSSDFAQLVTEALRARVVANQKTAAEQEVAA